MRIICSVCGKQAIDGIVSQYDKDITTLIGARVSFNSNECFCGHCSQDMDDNGLFPEEQLLELYDK